MSNFKKIYHKHMRKAWFILLQSKNICYMVEIKTCFFKHPPPPYRKNGAAIPATRPPPAAVPATPPFPLSLFKYLFLTIPRKMLWSCSKFQGLFALKSKEEKLFTAFCYLQPFRQQGNFSTTRLKMGESKYFKNKTSQNNFAFLKR